MKILLRSIHFSLLVFLISCQNSGDKKEFNFDVIIRGGTVIDGSGQPGVVTDLAINKDTIAFIGDVRII